MGVRNTTFRIVSRFMSGAARFSVLDVFDDSDDSSVLSIDDDPVPVLSSPPTNVKPFKMQKIFPPPVNLNVQVTDSAQSTAPISGLLKLLESSSDDCAAPDSEDTFGYSDAFFLLNSRYARSSQLHSNTRTPLSTLLPSADRTLSAARAQNSRDEPPSPPPPLLTTSTHPPSSPPPSPSAPALPLTQNSDDSDNSEQSCLDSDEILRLMDTMKCYGCSIDWKLAVEAVTWVVSCRLNERIRCDVC